MSQETEIFFKGLRVDLALKQLALQHETMAEVWDACPNPVWLFTLLNEAGFDNDAAVRALMAKMARRVQGHFPDAACERAIERAEAFAQGKLERDRLFNAFAEAQSVALSTMPFEGVPSRAASIAKLAAWTPNPISEDGKSLCVIAADMATEVPGLLAQASKGGPFVRTVASSAIASDIRSVLGNPFRQDASLRMRATVKSQGLRRWAKKMKMTFDLKPSTMDWKAVLASGPFPVVEEAAPTSLVAASKLYRTVLKAYPNQGLPCPGDTPVEA